jgi:catechol 2,3-dioxygenase-like lactoylglutathione lyase family enzyme
VELAFSEVAVGSCGFPPPSVGCIRYTKGTAGRRWKKAAAALAVYFRDPDGHLLEVTQVH